MLFRSQKVSKEMLIKYAHKIDELPFKPWEDALKICKFPEVVLEKYISKFNKQEIGIMESFQELSENFIKKHYEKLNINVILHTQLISHDFIKEFNLNDILLTNLETNIYNFNKSNSNNKQTSFENTPSLICPDCNHEHDESTICSICFHFRDSSQYLQEQNLDEQNLDDHDYNLHDYIKANWSKTSSFLYNKKSVKLNKSQPLVNFEYFEVSDILDDIEFNANYKFNYLLCMENPSTNELYLNDVCNINKKSKKTHSLLNLVYASITIQNWWKNLLYKPNGIFYDIYEMDFNLHAN